MHDLQISEKNIAWLPDYNTNKWFGQEIYQYILYILAYYNLYHKRNQNPRSMTSAPVINAADTAVTQIAILEADEAIHKSRRNKYHCRA